MKSADLLTGLVRRKEAASASFAYAIGEFERRLSGRKGDYILEFHGVDKIGFDLFNWRFLSEHNLRRLVSFLCKNGSIVSLESMINTEEDGLRFALTFDDGYQSIKKIAAELADEGIPLTLFITPNETGDKMLWTDQVDIAQRVATIKQLEIDGRQVINNSSQYILGDGTLLSSFLKEAPASIIESVQKKLALSSSVLTRYETYWRLLDKDDIKELSRHQTITFGSHGMSHTSMDVLSESALLKELTSSKNWIENTTGRPVYYLAFPCGRHNAKTIEVGHQAGYQHFFVESKINAEKILLPHISRRIGLYNRGYFSLLIKDLVESK